METPFQKEIIGSFLCLLLENKAKLQKKLQPQKRELQWAKQFRFQGGVGSDILPQSGFADMERVSGMPAHCELLSLCSLIQRRDKPPQQRQTAKALLPQFFVCAVATHKWIHFCSRTPFRLTSRVGFLQECS
jgi:hypothetical protein